MRYLQFCLGLYFISLTLLFAQSSQKPCSAAEYRQFDFWIGDWDAYDLTDANKIVARNRVDLVLDGCAIREVYEGASGGRGESYSIYDRTRGVWHQTWVTNKGELLTLEGSDSNGKMILTGTDRTKPPGPRLVRGIWEKVTNGVRETADFSTDGGKTWHPWFDIVFRRHK